MKPDAASDAVGADGAARRSLSVETFSREETVAFGTALAAALREGDVVEMDGDLGAGKTALTEGIARGLAVRGAVSSPTFTLLIDHAAGPRGLPLHHFDAYRLQDADEFLQLGFDEIVGSGGVTVVEWAGRVRAALPEEAVLVVASRRDELGEDVRRLDVTFPEDRETDAAALARAVEELVRAREEGSPC
jgi:tRNA threonylcarbamoyladenosine biosynthesis protein TsaE